MSARWVPNSAGEAALLNELGQGMANFDTMVRDNARTLSPRKWRNTGRYRRTIKASTYVNGKLVDGEPIRATGFRPESSPIHGIVYTQHFTGHLLEVTGAQPHDIPIHTAHGTLVIKHPGFTRKPHFLPGLLMAAGQAGVVMRGKRLEMAGKYGR